MDQEALFDALVRLRDAAEVANGNAHEILSRYRRKPDFSHASSSGIPREAKAQERAAARDHLLYEHVSIKYIQSAVRKGRAADVLDATYLIQRAVASVLRSPVVFVGQRSYPTAHEAAIAMGEAVLDAWQNAGGYDAVERAPDRMHATQEGCYAEIAIEVSLDLWRRLRRLRKGFPADLWGQIQLEFQTAIDRLEAAEQAATNLAARMSEVTPDTPPKNDGGDGGEKKDANDPDEPGALMSAGDLARRFKVSEPALKKALERWRKKHDGGWTENTNTGPNNAKFLYYVSAVRSVVDKLKTSRQRHAK